MIFKKVKINESCKRSEKLLQISFALGIIFRYKGKFSNKGNADKKRKELILWL